MRHGCPCMRGRFRHSLARRTRRPSRTSDHAARLATPPRRRRCHLGCGDPSASVRAWRADRPIRPAGVQTLTPDECGDDSPELTLATDTVIRMSRPRLLTTAEGTNTGAFAPLDWGLLCTAGIWEASFLFIAIGLDAFDPSLITTLRITFGFGLLAFLPATRRSIARADWPRLVLVGITWVAIPLSMFPLAERHVSSAVTGMLNGATPLFAAAVATLMLQKFPPRQRIYKAGDSGGRGYIVLSGMVRVTTVDEDHQEVVVDEPAVGEFFGFASMLDQTPHQTSATPASCASKESARIMGCWTCRSASAGHAPLLAPALACMALGALGTGVAYVAMGTLVGRVGSTRASITTYVIPVVAIILGAVFRNDHIAPLAIAGTAVVLSGAWITGRSRAS